MFKKSFNAGYIDNDFMDSYTVVFSDVHREHYFKVEHVAQKHKEIRVLMTTIIENFLVMVHT